MKPSVEDEAIIERFADALWVERGLSRNTLMAYQTDLVKLASWLGVNCSRPLLSARRQDLLEYLAAQSLTGRKPRTTARLLSCLRQFYQHAMREGWITTDPSARIEAPRLGRPLPKSLTEQEVEALLAAPDPQDPEGYRDRVMLEVLYATGLRVSELVGLRQEQLSLTQGLVRVIGKGGKERLVPLGEEALAWLEKFFKGPRQGCLCINS